MSLVGKRILITGGAGFIGSHIVDRLVAAGCRRIVAVDNMVRGQPANLADALRSGCVELIEGDIRDRRLMGELVAGSDLIFHQAALRITHCAAEPGSASRSWPTPPSICSISASVTASSGSWQPPRPRSTAWRRGSRRTRTTTRMTTAPGTAALKLFNEGMLRAFRDMHGLDYVALRYFNVYGPRMDLHGKYTEVLVRWMERIEAGLPPVIFGDGSQTMDFVHVHDVAEANLCALLGDASDVALNIGSGTETSLRQLAGAPRRGDGPTRSRARTRARAGGQSGATAVG